MLSLGENVINAPHVRRCIYVDFATGSYKIMFVNHVVTRVSFVSHVHELHPSHAFIIVPDKPVDVPDPAEYNLNAPPDLQEEICKYPNLSVHETCSRYFSSKTPWGQVCTVSCLGSIVPLFF